MPSKIGLVDADLLNSEPACRGGIAYDVPLRGATSPRAPEIEIGGGAPTPALSSVIMVKSDWASAAAGAHARAHTAKAVTVKDRRNEGSSGKRVGESDGECGLKAYGYWVFGVS